MDEEWIGTFLLAGLPERYNTMLMGIESSGVKISGDLIKQKLLQDVNSNTSATNTESAFFSAKYKKPFAKKKGLRCYNCNEIGHKADKCTKQKPKNEKPKPAVFSAVFLSGDFGKHEWYIDSGASRHMTLNENWLLNKCEPDSNEMVVADNTTMKVKCKGSLIMHTKVNNTVFEIKVNNVLYVPNLTTNLLSVSQIASNNNSVVFNMDGGRILNEKNEIIATANLVNSVYQLNANLAPASTYALLTGDSDIDT